MWFRKKTNKPFAPINFGSGLLRPVTLDEWQAFRAFYLRALKEHPTCSADDYSMMKDVEAEQWKAMIEHALTDIGSFLAAYVDKSTGAYHGLVYLHGHNEAKRSHETDVHLFLMTNGAVQYAEEMWQAVFDYLKANGDIERIKAPVNSRDRESVILYTKLGFRRYGFDEQFYRIGKKYLDAVLMMKTL